MTEFAANNPWLLLVFGVLVGMLLGGLVVTLLERKKSGGRTVEAVQQELDEYKEEVGKHFATTSELFRDMTEKYRDVYNHLASGSQSLCEDVMEHTRLEFTQAKEIDSNGSSDARDETMTDSADTEQAKSDQTDTTTETESVQQPSAAPTAQDGATAKRDDPPLGV